MGQQNCKEQRLGYENGLVDLLNMEEANTVLRQEYLEIFEDHFTTLTFIIDSSIEKDSSKTAIEDFDIKRVLGRGTFGKVLLVEQKQTHNYYALKSIKKKVLMKTFQVDNAKAERAIMAKLEHPFIVDLKYAFQNPQKLYMVFEFVIGGELFFRLQKEDHFSDSKAKFYSAEILLALKFLHSKGIIYRDLKLQNVLIDKNGHIKITDFGLAKQLTNTIGS